MPRSYSHFQKSYWDENLTNLKHESIEAYKSWHSHNRPPTGPVFERKKNAHYSYKKALREAQNASDARISDELLSDLAPDEPLLPLIAVVLERGQLDRGGDAE